MKVLFTLSILLMTTLIYSQYNYGLDVEQHDARIEGKLNLNYLDRNLVIGEKAGISIDTTGLFNGEDNTIIGFNSGFTLNQGSLNTFIGHQSGAFIDAGGANTFIGANAGVSNFNSDGSAFWNIGIGFQSGASTESNQSIYLGNNAGLGCTNCNRSIYIGHQHSGYQNFGPNKLVIDNLNSDGNPLIFGDFNDNNLLINGSFQIRDALQLIPQSPPSGSCGNNGEMLYGSDDELYLCKGGTWKQVMTN